MKRTPLNTSRLLCGAIIMLAPALHSPLLAQQQVNDTTLNRTVVVEQQYNPDIMDAQKVNVLPEVQELTSTPNEVEYDKKVAPATVLPGTAMAAYAGEEKQHYAKQGYVRLGYGNKGNLDTEANYLFMLSPKDRLNVSLGVQGMNGECDLMLGVADKWDSYFYRTKAGVDYLHQYDRLNLNLAGNFGLSNFNNIPHYELDRQRFTSGDFHVGVNSTDKNLPIQFNAETNLMLYSRAYNYARTYSYGAADNGSINETQIRTKGDFVGEVSDERKVGVAFEMNNLFYNEDGLDNYTTLLFNPYYVWEREGVWKLRAGINTDLAFSHGKKFQVSPDVRAEYIPSEGYVLYASATGGRQLTDFRRLEQANPYADALWAISSEDSYEQLNAMLGFKMSPVSGLWLNLYGGHQRMKNDLFSVFSYTDYAWESSIVLFGREKTNNYFGGLQASYTYKDLFGFNAKGQIYHWNADDNDVALQFKPSTTLDFKFDVRPITDLNLSLSYEYVKREEVYKDWVGISGYREKEINNLSVSGTYDLFEGISIYARFSNLLNKKYAYYPLSPMPGFNFVGGMMFSF